MMYFSLHAIRSLSSGSSGSNSVIAPFKAIAIPQVSTAAISFVASFAMVFMIPRTEKGLSTPYRRIIFGLCMSDVLQSFAFLTGPIIVPSDLSGSWGLGSQATCRTVGFLLTFGLSAVPMYTCLLCWYYLCKLKHRMANDTFSYRYEWKCHLFIFAYNFVAACVALELDILHPAFTKSFCQVSVIPTGCRMSPDIVGECDPILASRSKMYTLLDSYILNVLCLLGIIGIMTKLLCHGISMSRISLVSESPPVESPSLVRQSSSGSMEEDKDENENDEGDGIVRDTNGFGQRNMDPSLSNHSRISSNELEINPDIEHGRQQRAQARARADVIRLSILYRRETLLQATCYVGAFLLTYGPVFVIWGIFLAGEIPSKTLQIVPFIFYPLGGLFNILVYTRPQTAHLKRISPGRSWMQCLWLVLKAGGEMPNIEAENNMIHASALNLHDVDDPTFSLPYDFGSIATPPPARLSGMNVSALRAQNSDENHP